MYKGTFRTAGWHCRVGEGGRKSSIALAWHFINLQMNRLESINHVWDIDSLRTAYSTGFIIVPNVKRTSHLFEVHL